MGFCNNRKFKITIAHVTNKIATQFNEAAGYRQVNLYDLRMFPLEPYFQLARSVAQRGENKGNSRGKPKTRNSFREVTVKIFYSVA
jgi:hypothetical protein